MDDFDVYLNGLIDEYFSPLWDRVNKIKEELGLLNEVNQLPDSDYFKFYFNG